MDFEHFTCKPPIVNLCQIKINGLDLIVTLLQVRYLDLQSNLLSLKLSHSGPDTGLGNPTQLIELSGPPIVLKLSCLDRSDPLR